MQLRIAIVTCLLTGGVGLAAGWTLAGNPDAPVIAQPRAGATRMEIRNRMVTKLVDHLVKHEFEQARADFSTELAAGVTTERLQMLWNELEVKLGGFKDVAETKHEQIQGFDVYLVRLEFELDAVNLRVAVGRDDKLIGVYIQPVGQPVLGV
jgi:hypothetical protein